MKMAASAGRHLRHYLPQPLHNPGWNERGHIWRKTSKNLTLPTIRLVSNFRDYVSLERTLLVLRNIGTGPIEMRIVVIDRTRMLCMGLLLSHREGHDQRKRNCT